MYLTRRKALLIGCWFSIWSITLGCIGIDGDGIATTVRLMKHEAATIKSSSQSIRHGCHTFTVASVGFSNGWVSFPANAEAAKWCCHRCDIIVKAPAAALYYSPKRRGSQEGQLPMLFWCYRGFQAAAAVTHVEAVVINPKKPRAECLIFLFTIPDPKAFFLCVSCWDSQRQW